MSKEKSNFITTEDIPRLFATFTILAAGFAQGAGVAILGPALPELSENLELAPTEIGSVFSWRGLGSLVGTLSAAVAIHNKYLIISKHTMVAVFIIFSCLVTVILPPIVTSLYPDTDSAFVLVKLLIFLQGLGFGVMDILSNIGIQEIWGQRVKPWMQIRNLLECFGAVSAPLSISYFGFDNAFLICGSYGLASLLGIILELYPLYRERNKYSKEDYIAPELQNLTTNLESIQEEMSDDLDFDPNFISDFVTFETPIESEEIVTRDRVLSFATPQLVDLLENKPIAQILDVHIVPRNVNVTMAGFSFILLGLTFSFGGWISTYTLMIDPDISFPEAAQMTTLFSFCVCISAIYSIPVSFYFSTSFLLRFQLSILLVGALILFIPMNPLLLNKCSAVLIGLAISSIFTLIMTVANDYQMTMDSSAVFFIVVGGGLGQSTVPAFVGILIDNFGSTIFPIFLTFSALLMVFGYIYVHFVLVFEMKRLQYPMVSEGFVDEITGLLEGSVASIFDISENGVEVTRARSQSRLTRGWRSLSVEKYSGAAGLEMILESEDTPLTLDITPRVKSLGSLGTNHVSYQAQAVDTRIPFNTNKPTN